MLTVELFLSAAPRDEHALLAGAAAWRDRHQGAIAWSFVATGPAGSVVVAHLDRASVAALPPQVGWREIAPLAPAPMIHVLVGDGLPFVRGSVAHPFCVHPDDDATRAPISGRRADGRWITCVVETASLVDWRIDEVTEPAALWEHRAHGAVWDLARAEALLARMRR